MLSILPAINSCSSALVTDFLPSRKDLLLKQKTASMLINVRKPEEEASAYCFPSKLFEYMISGSPVLSFKIPGIPDEYFDYLIPMENSNPKTIANAIINVGNMKTDDRETLGNKSREFVLNNKKKSKVLSFNFFFHKRLYFIMV